MSSKRFLENRENWAAFAAGQVGQLGVKDFRLIGVVGFGASAMEGGHADIIGCQPKHCKGSSQG